MRKDITVIRARDMVSKYRLDVIALLEPMIQPEQHTVVNMGLKDYNTNIIHNGVADELPDI